MRRCNEIVSEAISQRLMGYAFCIVNASHPKWTPVRIDVGGTSCMVLNQPLSLSAASPNGKIGE